MEEFLYSVGCIAALIILPILFFMLRSVRRINRSLTDRVVRLEQAVDAIESKLSPEQQQSVADSLSALAAAQTDVTDDLSPDKLSTDELSTDELPANEALHSDLQPLEDALIDGSPSTSQPSVVPSEPALIVGISPAQSARIDADRTPESNQANPNGQSRLSALSPLFGWFAKMHLMVQIGILILFIGIAFLIKFVADQGLLSIELRLLTSAFFGAALTTIGWRLRNRARTYGMALMGGGLAIAYLTVYGALLYTAFPPTLAFPLFVLLGIIGGLLAVLTNAWILAFLAIVGAFLAPILASSGGGSHVTLFSYYAVLNASILAIAWFKTWRSLNLVGYFFTMIVGLLWGLESYTPALFRSTEFFLILFYVFYVLIAVLFAARRTQEIAAEPAENSNTKLTRHDAVDVTLIFGNPLVAFSIQAYLMQDVRYGMAISTFAAGLLYAALAILFVMRWRSFRVVAESFLFLAGLFLALTVPLTFALDATAAIWAVMGLAWVWAGTIRRRWWQIGWGGLIQLGAAVAVVGNTNFFNFFEPAAFVNGPYLNALLISLSALGSGYLLNRARRFNMVAQAETKAEPEVDAGLEQDIQIAADEQADSTSKTALKTTSKVSRPTDGLLIAGWIATLWGYLWWFSSGLLQVVDFVQEQESETYWVATSLAFIALSTGAAEWIGRRLRWPAVRLPVVMLLPILMVGLLAQAAFVEWPFAAGGWYAWPTGLAVVYWALYGWERSDRALRSPALARLLRYQHIGALWLIVGLITWLGQYLITLWTDAGGWLGLVIFGILALTIWLLLRYGERLPWPVRGRLPLYQRWGAGPVLALGLLLNYGVNMTEGSAQPLPYLPLLNPLDLVQVAFFTVAFGWVSRTLDKAKRIGYWIVGIAAFFTFNAGLARAVHHLLDVPWAFETLMDSSPLQTLLAVSWSVLAMVLMFLSHRRGEGWRGVWFAGALVLGLTVVKLFTIDLANSGTIARIISFMGTGVLILVIAYFAPAPPRVEAVQNESEKTT